MSDFLRQAMTSQIAHVRGVDAAAAAAAAANVPAPAPAASTLTLDSAAITNMVVDSAAAFDSMLLKRESLAVVNQWATTKLDELDAGETMADRLMNMLVGVVDIDKDGELSDDEQDAVNVGLNGVFDYLATLGVSEADATALLSDWSVEVADRVRELVAAALPTGEDAEMDLIDNMVFTPEDQVPVFDSATDAGVQMDAAYRRVVAVRAGKKVKINKRIAGVVRLSARQKVSLRKARAKAHNPAAMASRRRSMRLRASSNLGSH